MHPLAPNSLRRGLAVLLVLACASSVAIAQPRRPRGPRVVVPIQPAPASPYAVGQSIEVEWYGQWYAARVLAVEASGSFRIRYEGWSEAWDESVTRERTRLPGGGAPVVATPPPPPALPSVPNLVVNGGFEQPALAGGTFQILPQLVGWSLTRGRGFEVQSGVAGAPSEGRQFLELDAEEPTGLSQDLATAPGATYEVQLAFSPRPGTPAEDNRVLVLWDGRPVMRLRGDGRALGETSWTTHSVWVVAGSRRSRLEIRDEGTPNGLGGYVDDVRVTPAR